MDVALLERETWHGGQLLAFSGLDGPTKYASGLVLRTGFETGLIEAKFPATAHIQTVGAGGPFAIASDWFEFKGSHRSAFVDAHHILIEGPVSVELDAPLRCESKGNLTLLGVAECFQSNHLDLDLDDLLAHRQSWLRSVAVPEGLPPRTQCTLAKALSVMKGQVCSPEGNTRHLWTTPDRWPHRKMWLWDSAFHAIGWRWIDKDVAKQSLLAVLDHQQPDGFVPHAATPIGCSTITQPPVLALAAWLIDRNDKEWLATVYPKLVAYIAWDLANRDSDGNGLPEWAIEGDPLCRSGESGMDNSVRFDEATRMDAVDFSSFLALEQQILAQMAHQLGTPGQAAERSFESNETCRAIRSRLWSVDRQFFVDYDLDRNRPSDVLSSAGFLPMLCGAADRDQAEALLRHMENPVTFGTALPVPSIAANDPHYAKDMWRGPVWVNLNWLIARGLDRYGFDHQAEALRTATLDAIESNCERFGTVFEFYDALGETDPPNLLRKGSCDPKASPYHQVFFDYGWTATLYVDLVFSRFRSAN